MIFAPNLNAMFFPLLHAALPEVQGMSRKESRGLSWDAEGDTLRGGPSLRKVCTPRLRDQTWRQNRPSPGYLPTWAWTPRVVAP